MDTSAKISCCKTCLLAENMKTCKVCQFNAGLEIVTVTKSEKPKYILSRSWADRHLNSDDDLKYFKGGAVIR